MAGLSFPALRQPVFRAYFFGAASAMMADSIEHIGLFTVGLGGSLIGIHLSLALSAALLLAITLAMLWTMVPSR